MRNSSELLNKKFFFWDFDGVIAHTDAIRIGGFVYALKGELQGNIDFFLDYHLRNGGLSRYEKFHFYYGAYLKLSEDEAIKKIARALGRYSVHMKKHLFDKKILNNDWLTFIINLDRSWEITHFLISASMEEELRDLCSYLEIGSFFKEILGSPTPKVQNISNCIERNELDRDQICYIGDSMNDFESASRNMIDFLGYNYSGDNDVLRVKSFSSINKD